MSRIKDNLKVLTNIYMGMAYIPKVSRNLSVKQPMRIYHQADEDMYPSNNAENLLGALRQDPGSNKIVHPKRIDVTEVDCSKRLRRFVSVTVCEIAVYGDSDESDCKILEAIEEGWA